MYFIPVSCLFLGLLGFGGFSMAKLSNQRGEWGKHFSSSCPRVSIVLHHTQEPTKVVDLSWQYECKDCLYFLRLCLHSCPISTDHWPSVNLHYISALQPPGTTEPEHGCHPIPCPLNPKFFYKVRGDLLFYLVRILCTVWCNIICHC